MYAEIEKMKNELEKGLPFDESVFEYIVGISDAFEKQKTIEAVRVIAKDCGRLREFDRLLKAYTKKSAEWKKRYDSGKTNFTDAPVILSCGKFEADDTGIHSVSVNNEGVMTTNVVCHHPILPVERMVNLDDDTEKVKVAFFKDGDWKTITVSTSDLLNSRKIVFLADYGVLVTSETAKNLVEYMLETLSLNTDSLPRYRSISRLGWVGDEFAPYVTDIRFDGDAQFRSVYEQVREKGSLDVWKSHISELRTNKIVRLVLAASFASPLIEVVGALPFVLHLWGTTGFGKTVTLMLASSVWGNPEMGCLTKTMNMTANAMARTSCFLHSIPFCADELQQIKTNWRDWNTYDTLIMYLTEGIDRGRALRGGGVEKTKVWKNSFIFTGEEPITKGGSGGGVKNRVIEIECEDKIIPDGHKTANLVKSNYGEAGKVFIEHVKDWLERDPEGIKIALKQLTDEIIATANTTDKQAMSMALMLLADRIACECLFTDEKALTVAEVQEFLVPSDTVRIEKRAYDFILQQIARNKSCFLPEARDSWGKICSGHALMNKTVVCDVLARGGFDFDAVKKGWAKAGYIEKSNDGKYAQLVRGVDGVRFRAVKILLNAGEESFDDDEYRELEEENYL